MVWNAVTENTKPLLKTIFLILAFLSGHCFADASPFVSAVLGKVSGNAECVSALKDLSEFRLLFSLPEYQEFVTEKKTAALKGKLSTWSPDLILRIYSQLDSEFLYRCPDAEPLTRTRDFLGGLYLSNLGIPADKLKPSQTNLLVHGLVMLKEDSPVVAAKIKKIKRQGVGTSLLAQVYGHADYINDTVVVSGSKIPLAKIKAFVKEMCLGSKECLLWHPSAIWKLVLTDERGVASYVPELRTLVLSEELIEDPNTLMKTVVLHELAHSAEAAVWNIKRVRWLDTFATFSGWAKEKERWQVAVNKLAIPRADFLTELSKGSNYSILPDDVYIPKQSGKEGFVFAKSYLESVKRDDPSEDLADTIAAFRFAPQRFCDNGKLALAKKAEWVQQNVFPGLPPLKCN